MLYLIFFSLNRQKNKKYSVIHEKKLNYSKNLSKPCTCVGLQTCYRDLTSLVVLIAVVEPNEMKKNDLQSMKKYMFLTHRQLVQYTFLKNNIPFHTSIISSLINLVHMMNRRHFRQNTIPVDKTLHQRDDTVPPSYRSVCAHDSIMTRLYDFDFISMLAIVATLFAVKKTFICSENRSNLQFDLESSFVNLCRYTKTSRWMILSRRRSSTQV